MSFTIRDAEETDVERIRDLFVTAYGEHFPYPEMYDTHWLKKAVFSDDTIFLIAEIDDEIVATGSIIMDVGGLNDLIGELGRLVASPAEKARGAAELLVAELIKRISNKVQFAYGEVRTIHRGSQTLGEQFGWKPVGFEPMKFQVSRRESTVYYARLNDTARELRCNNPKVIPEIYPLAQMALHNLGLPADAICYNEEDGYPTGQTFHLERLEETGVTSLLRIERGRVSNREIFGNFSLSRGFFRISDTNSHYLVARNGKTVLGAIGFTHDPIDSRVRIFELIEFDDSVKGFLLASVDNIAREEFGAAYQEVDISAYSPKMQRTLERLGFVAVAYCPSMVFDNIERLDIIRMAKLNVQYDLGPIRILDSVAQIKDIVEAALQDRLVGMEINQGTRKAVIFRNIPDGDLHHLASIAVLREFEKGHILIRQGDVANYIYVIAEGRADVIADGEIIASLGEGSTSGEMALVEKMVRSADVVIAEDSRVIEIEIKRLEQLMEKYPRLGYAVARNLATGLSTKLRLHIEEPR